MAAQTKQKAKGLYPKLAEAIAEVEHVAKDGRNDHFKYRYTSAEEVYRELRGPLLSRGLVFVPSVESAENGGDRSLVRYRMTIVDSETGEALTADWIGEGQDRGDKAPYKAATGACKTFLRHLFMLPADDDPEADAQGARTPQARRPQARRSDGGTERPASAKQKGLVHALCDKAGYSKDEQHAVVEGLFGQPHVDRLTTKQASTLIDQLGEEGKDGQALLGRLRETAERDERLAKVVARHLTDEPEPGQVSADDSDIPF